MDNRFQHLSEKDLNRTSKELFQIIYSSSVFGSSYTRKTKKKKKLTGIHAYIEECKELYKLKTGYNFSGTHFDWYFEEPDNRKKNSNVYSPTKGAMII
jgi:hypothetical protein